jgi:Lrp/AsnC family transcriptional regulator
VLAADPEAGKPGLGGRVALLNADKLNVGVSVFIAVKTSQHNAE